MKNLILFLLISQFNFAQTQLISGIVKDSTGIIVGAKIVNKAQKSYGTTGFNGKFIIPAHINDTLVISYIGKLNEIHVIKNYNDLVVFMKSGPEIKTTLGYTPSVRRKVNYEEINYRKIYILGGIVSAIGKKETEFSKKYGVIFHDFGCMPPANLSEFEKINTKTFDYLMATFDNQIWIRQLKPETIGLKKWMFDHKIELKN